MNIFKYFKYFFHGLQKPKHVVVNIKIHNKALIILSIFLTLMFFAGCVSVTSSENVTLAQDIDDVVNEKNTDDILTVEGSSTGTDDGSGLKELESENKPAATYKNNEIIGAAYEEDNGDSESQVLGAGEYTVILSFGNSYNEYEQIFSYTITGPENLDGRLELSIDGNSLGTFDIDGESGLKSIGPLDAGSHTYSAEFRSNGGDSGSGSGPFTISQASSSIDIIEPSQSSIEMDVDDSVNLNVYMDPSSVSPTISSSDDNVAKVENGKIIAVGAGTATITVSFEGNTNYKLQKVKQSLLL